MAMSLESSYFPRVISGPSLSSVEEMKYEALRLRTFEHWLAFDRASPLILAKAGFYYTGNDDIVQCVVCQLSKGGWNRMMNPFLTHRDLSPGCGFCQELDGHNIPMYVPEERVCQEIQDTLHRKYCGTDTSYPSIAVSDERTSNFSSNALGPRNFPIVATDSGSSESGQPTIGIGHRSLGHDTEAAPTREEFAPMKFEASRFGSFSSNWPRANTPDPRDLARAGFFYTGTVDRVQCAFCRGILRNWDEDDVPMEEHRRHFPSCPFVLGTDSGNVPDPAAIITANRTGEFLNVKEPAAVVSDAALGIVTERPKHPQYAVEASRVNSFRTWPSGKEQTPEMLARAGFFYAGFGDNVKCFFCDGGLRSWEKGDDPWKEHARWFAQCPYVRQVKGQDFIQRCARDDDIRTGTKGADLKHASTSASSGHTAAVRHVEPRELSARMDSPIVQTVLSMDLPRDRVEEAIRQRLFSTGDDFPSVGALVDAVYNVPEPSTSAPAVTPLEELTSMGDTGSKGGDSKPRTAEDDNMEMSDEDEDSTSLIEENRALKEQRMCKICMDEEVNVVFLPCGHLVCCASCAPALRKCPICRANIRGTVRAFMS